MPRKTDMSHCRFVLIACIASLAIPVLQSVAHAEPDPNEIGAQPQGVPTVAQGREAWAKILVGQELAAGRQVQFLPRPDYHLTLDQKDNLDLTDGKLASKNNDRIWFQKDAVGWYLTPGETVSVLVDLEREEEIGRVAIRVLGGREQGSLVFPKGFEILVSSDKETFYRLSELQKLQPAESELSDFKTTFYLPEPKKAYMHPFSFDTNVKARYVVIRMTRESGIFADEISIQRKWTPDAVTPLTQYPEARFYAEGVAVLPRKESQVVIENVVTPCYFVVQDNREGKATGKIDMLVDVPAGIELIGAAGLNFESQAAPKPGERRYRVDLLKRGTGRYGPYFFQVKDKTKVPADARFRVTARVAGENSHVVETPLRTVVLPEVDTRGVLDVSLAWMNEGNALTWPGFQQEFRKLGFDYVSAFPRWYQTPDKKMALEAGYSVGLAADAGQYNVLLEKVKSGSSNALQLLDESRKKNFRIVANDSPFHILGKTLDEALKAGKIPEQEQREIFNVVDGKVGKYVHPLYRGRYFQNEISRIKMQVEVTRPDEFYLDIEWWYESVDESQKDERMIAAWKASGKTWEDFRSDIGTDVLRAVRKAVDEAARNAGIAAPKIGLYNSHASGHQVQKFFEFSKLYPDIIQYSMPSLYVQGRTLDVIAKIRADYAKLGNRDIIPWLTAGTYGEFDPQHMETMVLESILNGARGVTYYYFYDFDPMDFYHHANALSLLMKHPQLVKAGKPKAWTGSNPDLNYTAFGTDRELFLMVGNYKRSRDGKSRVQIPLSSVGKIQNVVTGAALKAGRELSLDVPPGGYVLLHVSR